MEFTRGSIELPRDLKIHIEICSECSSYLHELFSLNKALAHSDFEVRPGEMDDLTFEKIESIASERKIRSRVINDIFKIKWAWVPAAAAAIIIAILFVPRMVNKPAINGSGDIDFYPPNDITIEESLTSSDTLANQFLSTMAGDTTELDMASDELMIGSDINDMLNSLSNTELKALYKKLENLKG